MPFISWSDSLVIDEGFIDHQHRQLIDAINDLHRRVVAGEAARVPEVLSFLAIYADLHFAEEERWMARCGYTDVDRHRALHRGFIARVEAFRLECAGGGTMDQGVLEFLRGWLTSHIMGADRAFAPVLAEYRRANPAE